MNIQKSILFFSIFLTSFTCFTQNGTLKGKVVDEYNKAVPFASVILENTEKGTDTDENGEFEFNNLSPELYTIIVRSIGYETKKVYEILVTNTKPSIVNITLLESSEDLLELVVTATNFEKNIEAPISLKTIGIAEIERNPGANRDISKVLKSLPGVAITPGFRNDIIIRGGSPSENSYYLDGIEVPNINHFTTQGASGGAVGLLNVNFIQEVDFYAGAFPTSRGEALSSVINFKQKEGNPDYLTTALTLGSSDLAITLDGPLGKKTNFIFSVRRSYLELLFKLLKLPFLPAYNDAQFKIKTDIDNKNQLTFIGLGALDQFSLNQSVNDNETDQETIDRNNFILDNIAVNEQWSYTVGAKYTHFGKNSFQNYIISNNRLHNQAVKYLNNDDSDPNNKILDYNSDEIETKFRFENVTTKNNWRLSYGAGYQNAIYTNSTYQKSYNENGPVFFNYDTKLTLNKYALFGQISNSFFNRRLDLSFGLRTDFSDYSTNVNNPLEQLSPRFSFSYHFTERFSLNGNIGKYYQLPPYTALGYEDNNGNRINKSTLDYINSTHYVLGVEYISKFNAKFSIEGFYKDYGNYPLLLTNGISLANVGNDYGVVGNEPAASLSEGRAYGVEFLYQQKMLKNFFGILSYTLVTSEFTNKDEEYAASSWDNGNMLSITFGRNFKNNWSLGIKYQYSGATPYTPYDVQTSSLKASWDARQSPVLNYNDINNQRNSSFNSLDIRVDKKWYLNKVNLNLYVDIQNILGATTTFQPYLTTETDDNGNNITDPNDPTRYLMKTIPNTSGTILPTIGVIFEFSTKTKKK